MDFIFVRAERSALENKERAYLAAARRTDRPFERRLQSLQKASELHYARTGRRFDISAAEIARPGRSVREVPPSPRIPQVQSFGQGTDTRPRKKGRPAKKKKKNLGNDASQEQEYNALPVSQYWTQRAQPAPPIQYQTYEPGTIPPCSGNDVPQNNFENTGLEDFINYSAYEQALRDSEAANCNLMTNQVQGHEEFLNFQNTGLGEFQENEAADVMTNQVQGQEEILNFQYTGLGEFQEYEAANVTTNQVQGQEEILNLQYTGLGEFPWACEEAFQASEAADVMTYQGQEEIQNSENTGWVEFLNFQNTGLGEFQASEAADVMTNQVQGQEEIQNSENTGWVEFLNLQNTGLGEFPRAFEEAFQASEAAGFLAAQVQGYGEIQAPGHGEIQAPGHGDVEGTPGLSVGDVPSSFQEAYNWHRFRESPLENLTPWELEVDEVLSHPGHPHRTS